MAAALMSKPMCRNALQRRTRACGEPMEKPGPQDPGSVAVRASTCTMDASWNSVPDARFVQEAERAVLRQGQGEVAGRTFLRLKHAVLRVVRTFPQTTASRSEAGCSALHSVDPYRYSRLHRYPVLCGMRLEVIYLCSANSPGSSPASSSISDCSTPPSAAD
ncbi:hypothetical protein BBK36DRAFT_1139600 [Trichoderma citrinoviride]|uniref:Uncharacterized protein n=1 Tax=Trichoderma citrinoviride TaxID=58853 RepID=A0A2T4BFJ4_9HYPO|nr:hypothetical protein BBK36DRAFT_1139600 [Trichoderma citrinoviride]PTB68092.1 hypothetical protein BBK36DRAFT_1139600 [Trichoderma citrinoviride]